jgi:hypothetical protein
MDEWSRRGFMKSAFSATAAGAFTMKNGLLKTAWKAVGAKIPVDFRAALGFVRAVGGEEVAWYYTNGTFATREEILGPKGILKHEEHFKPGSAGYAWMSNLNLDVLSDEVLPKWHLDLAVRKESTTLQSTAGPVTLESGYRLILAGEIEVIVMDHRAAIYVAPTKAPGVTASNLSSAADYPGAVGLGYYKPRVSGL